MQPRFAPARVPAILLSSPLRAHARRRCGANGIRDLDCGTVGACGTAAAAIVASGGAHAAEGPPRRQGRVSSGGRGIREGSRRGRARYRQYDGQRDGRRGCRACRRSVRSTRRSPLLASGSSRRRCATASRSKAKCASRSIFATVTNPSRRRQRRRNRQLRLRRCRRRLPCRLRPRLSARTSRTSPDGSPAPSRGASDYHVDVGDARRGAARERLRVPQARARHPAHQRGRRGPRRAGVPARLRRARGPGHRVHRRTACPSTRAATCTATATPTRTSSSPSWSSRCASSRGRSIRARATTPSPAAPTTSSGSRSAASPRKYTRRQLRHPPRCCSSGARETASTGTFGGAELYQTDGFGQNRDGRRAHGDGAVRGRLGDRRSYRLTAQAYATSFHTAGVIREDDYERGPHRLLRQLRLRCQGERRLALLARRRRRDALGRRRAAQQVFVHRARRCACARTSPASCSTCRSRCRAARPARRPARPRTSWSGRVGARGSARLSRRRASARGRSSSSATSRAATTSRHAAAARGARPGIPYTTETDLDSQLGDIGLYADANLRALRWLALRGGVRADLFTYDVHRQLRGADGRAPLARRTRPATRAASRQQDFGRLPRARPARLDGGARPPAARLAARRPVLGLRAQRQLRAGRPLDRSRATSPRTRKTPFASVTAYEGGLTLRRAASRRHRRWSRRSVLFQTRVDHDLIFCADRRAQRARRRHDARGWLGALAARDRPFFDVVGQRDLRARDLRRHAPARRRTCPDVGASARDARAVRRRCPGAWRLWASRCAARSAPASPTSGRARSLRRAQRHHLHRRRVGDAGWWLFELGLVGTNLLDTQYRLGEYNYASDFHREPHPTLVPVRALHRGRRRVTFLLSFAINYGGRR